MTWVLGNAPLSARDFAALVRNADHQVELDDAAWKLVRRSRELVDQVAASSEPVYGLNTLLGSGRNTPVSAEKLLAYQVQVVRYHVSGIGPFLDREQSRALMLSRLVGFARGGSGVHPDTVEFYRQLFNRGVHPAIPRDGSVGSSDLTQLAALASVVIGEGQAFDAEGELVPGARALAAVGLEPLVLRPLEGLALISANSYSVGLGALELLRLDRLAEFADVALALSLEAIGRYQDSAALSAYSAPVAEARRLPGLAASSSAVRELLAGSYLQNPNRSSGVQDALSFRSAPQTHGALRAQIEALAEALEVELEGRSDNPLVDVPSGRLISGGNFQVLPLALSFESLRLALGHLGIISERRIAKLYPPQRLIRQAALAATEGVPEAEELPGLLWYSAAGLLAELKALAQPVTLGAPSLSDDIEDHSTLAPLALQQLQRSVEVVEKLLSIEALTAAFLILADTAERPLGAGTAVVVQQLAPLLAARLPASALVDEARSLLFGGIG
ncbi:histidine ammonia-lyase [Psychromicrobium silvestre]|uniref:Histidine ammonia-lyase n=1 Tax=Psychromicrobium silvestre TaxID=1645614 RepID=A0A7Y9S7U9_9MICC|nr:aromatic amino acid ammonia-lyase [Psychromicrobium silvestre]NYE96289.1 histidine ammonia-lyase [Psychromicrobium silvestre]